MTETRQSTFLTRDRKPVTVVAIDDHPLIRQAIRGLLATRDDMILVAEGSTGEHLFSLVAEHRPDVVILDLSLPQADSGNIQDRNFQALPSVARLHQEYPATSVIILSQYVITSLVHRAAKASIKGYLLKSDDLSLNLPGAIEAVSKGGVFFSESISQALFDGETQAPEPVLTERQREIILTIAQAPNDSYTQHAATLGIAESTLRNHLTKAFKVLGDNNITAAIVRCMQSGVIPAEQNRRDP